MEILSKQTNFDFLGKRKIFFLLSALLIGLSLYLWSDKGDQKFGVDFTGGHEFIVQFAPADATTGTTITPETHTIRDQLLAKGIEASRIQSFEAGSNQFSIRLPGGVEESAAVRDNVLGALKPAFGEGVSVLKTDYVGPTVGAELKRKALWAISLGLLCMLIYVAFRFEFAFGFGAVVAVLHDVLVAMGLYLLFDRQINMGTLAAALTIIGYSMNDTIVIFDRVREELFKNRSKETLSTLVNRSINFTLSRTILTHVLTLLAVVSLLVFGGSGELRDLSIFLLAGIIVGSYSTIYIASPAMIWWHKVRGGTEEV